MNGAGRHPVRAKGDPPFAKIVYIIFSAKKVEICLYKKFLCCWFCWRLVRQDCLFMMGYKINLDALAMGAGSKGLFLNKP